MALDTAEKETSLSEETQIEFNLFQLINRLEAAKEREVTIVEIAEETGLSQAGLYKAKNKAYSGVQFETLGKLMDYFARQGMPITISDMFTVKKVKEGEQSPAQVEKNADGSRKRLMPT